MTFFFEREKNIYKKEYERTFLRNVPARKNCRT
jgi:hypothetical protein